MILSFASFVNTIKKIGYKNVKYTERVGGKSPTNTGILAYFHIFYYIQFNFVLHTSLYV